MYMPPPLPPLLHNGHDKEHDSGSKSCLLLNPAQDIRPGMRAQLLDWLQEVAANFYVHRQTFQAAVNFIDRYLSRTTSFPPGQLQLLGPSY